MLIVKQCCRDNTQKFGQLNELVGNKPQFQLVLLMYLDLFTTKIQVFDIRFTVLALSIMGGFTMPIYWFQFMSCCMLSYL